jgi:uncharacterized RDD family membrane protein YckC
MSLVGHLEVGRSDRIPVDRPGTLRDRARTPVDVVVDNLSTTGCLFVHDSALPLGALISLGIAGLGIRHARISRVDPPHYACAFLVPVAQEDIVAALSAETLVTGAFPQMQPRVQPPVAPIGPIVVDEDGRDVRKFPVRIAIVAGALVMVLVIAALAAIAR